MKTTKRLLSAFLAVAMAASLCVGMAANAFAATYSDASVKTGDGSLSYCK